MDCGVLHGWKTDVEGWDTDLLGEFLGGRSNTDGEGILKNGKESSGLGC